VASCYFDRKKSSNGAENRAFQLLITVRHCTLCKTLRAVIVADIKECLCIAEISPGAIGSSKAELDELARFRARSP
jgi:hypothetical protein